jgi:uncharacterized protein YecT (DUF1311 family)
MVDDSPRLRSTRQPNWTTIALIAGLLLLLLIIAYFATGRNADQDRLTGTERAQTSTATTPEKACAAKGTYDLIKRELFRRAAQLRGSDQAAYDKLASVAVIRMDNPVMESEDSATHAVNCSGSLSLDLPPGVAAVGGRRSLTSDVDYTLQPAADGSGTVVLLRNADAIIAPLATLGRVEQVPTAPRPPMDSVEVTAPDDGDAIQPPEQPEPAVPSTTPPRPVSARPSFNCNKATTRGEVFVCGDAGLAALDRNMAAQFGRAMSRASPDERALLQSSRSRFLTYRDRCPDRQCIGDAYVARMREIRDIMEGRWAPPR